MDKTTIFQKWTMELMAIHRVDSLKELARALHIRYSYMKLFARVDGWMNAPGVIRAAHMPRLKISATAAAYFHKILEHINQQNQTHKSLTDHFGVTVIVGKNESPDAPTEG